MKLYFETLSLPPLLHSLLVLRFSMRVYHIQCLPLSLINPSFLVTSGPHLPGTVLLPCLMTFPLVSSCRLRLVVFLNQDSKHWFLPRAGFLLCVFF